MKNDHYKISSSFQAFGLNYSIYLGINKGQVARDMNISWNTDTSSLTPEALFELATYKLSDMAGYIEVTTVKDDKTKQLYDASKDKLRNIHVSLQKAAQFGKCYTLTFDQSIRSMGIRSLTISKK